MYDKVVVKHKGHLAEAEAALEKAVQSIKLNREKPKELPVLAMQELKEVVDNSRHLLMERMIEDVTSVLIK